MGIARCRGVGERGTPVPGGPSRHKVPVSRVSPRPAGEWDTRDPAGTAVPGSGTLLQGAGVPQQTGDNGVTLSPHPGMLWGELGCSHPNDPGLWNLESGIGGAVILLQTDLGSPPRLARCRVPHPSVLQVLGDAWMPSMWG